MPAKKKQASPDLDEIEQLAQEIFGAAATERTKKEAAALARRAQNAIQQQQEESRRNYVYNLKMQSLISQHCAQEEQRNANRTQNPDTGVPLEKPYLVWHELAPGKYIRYEQFTPAYMTDVMKMFAEELPEPYSIFTYEHFLMGWPDLGILLFGYEVDATGAAPTEATKGELIGSIVSKISLKLPLGPLRGYIAMLAVRPKWRGHRLGQRLVKVTVELMKRKRAVEVCLETPVRNERALKLYTEMGFAKTKYLTRYYLDGADAFRLKLWFASPNLSEN